MQRPTCRCRITSNCGIRWDRWGDSGPGQPAAASIGLPPASSGLPPASIGLPPAFPRPPAAFPGPPSAAGPGSRAGTIRLSAAFHRCGCACGEFRPFHRPNSRCAPAIKVAIGGISSGRAPDMATWHFPRRLIMLAFIVQLSATINSIIPTRLLCQSFIFFFPSCILWLTLTISTLWLTALISNMIEVTGLCMQNSALASHRHLHTNVTACSFFFER